jgi:hypothetical protein
LIDFPFVVLDDKRTSTENVHSTTSFVRGQAKDTTTCNERKNLQGENPRKCGNKRARVEQDSKSTSSSTVGYKQRFLLLSDHWMLVDDNKEIHHIIRSAARECKNRFPQTVIIIIVVVVVVVVVIVYVTTLSTCVYIYPNCRNNFVPFITFVVRMMIWKGNVSRFDKNRSAAISI